MFEPTYSIKNVFFGVSLAAFVDGLDFVINSLEFVLGLINPVLFIIDLIHKSMELLSDFDDFLFLDLKLIKDIFLSTLLSYSFLVALELL